MKIDLRHSFKDAQYQAAGLVESVAGTLADKPETTKDTARLIAAGAMTTVSPLGPIWLLTWAGLNSFKEYRRSAASSDENISREFTHLMLGVVALAAAFLAPSIYNAFSVINAKSDAPAAVKDSIAQGASAADNCATYGLVFFTWNTYKSTVCSHGEVKAVVDRTAVVKLDGKLVFVPLAEPN